MSGRAVAAVLLGLFLASCRSRSEVTDVDAGPVAAPSSTASASASEVLASASTAAHAVSPCDEVWRAAQVDVAFKEEPEDVARTGPRLERRFTVARQLQGAYRYQDQWASVLEYETGAVKGGVSYSLTVPDVLADLKGRKVAWASHREPAGCLASDGEEPVLLAGDTLRDEKGRLLLLTVPSAPTTPDGDVLLPPGLAPELRVHWEDTGCEAGKGTRTRGVRLRFESGAASVPVSLGETVHLTLSGVRYEVRVARAVADSAGRCGQAVFTVIREGLREQRPL
ncbi:hypothetical protein JY651_46745 [Pyxidicoccus parkwayensis]|uniref:Lipoprotein n=1 Tax=Pyxidicoccus parkwayensis TaxID=2813578 RepID=A0ABX7NV04_9BACT|nr:hypothetical protein [Pyxidicoccus parkwaysis]QSQ22533.1 hypothetical protein JY651_46745 [Pyxidicoccus parkwaysis]